MIRVEAGRYHQAANIWIVNADGSGVAPLTKLTAKSASSGAFAWAPNAAKITFVSSRALDGSDTANTSDGTNVWIMNADGSGAAALTRYTNVFIFACTWSPDGTIAFTSDGAFDGTDSANASGAMNLWVINADGSAAVPLSRLTAPGVNTADPQWQP